MTTKDYDLDARGIAQSIGLHVSIEQTARQICPVWTKKPCDHVHGNRYIIKLMNTRGEWLSFCFWDSMANRVSGKRPTVYDVLSCVASDASMPTDPDEVVSEFGEMKPSQAIAVAEHSKKLQAFFTRKEIERLGEIQ